MHYSLLSKIIY